MATFRDDVKRATGQYTLDGLNVDDAKRVHEIARVSAGMYYVDVEFSPDGQQYFASSLTDDLCRRWHGYHAALQAARTRLLADPAASDVAKGELAMHTEYAMMGVFYANLYSAMLLLPADVPKETVEQYRAMGTALSQQQAFVLMMLLASRLERAQPNPALSEAQREALVMRAAAQANAIIARCNTEARAKMDAARAAAAGAARP